MEMEVRWVAGVENCYVSLPFSLLQILESSLPGGRLPPILPLQLLSLSSHDVICHVAWSGSASSTPAVEIAQEFAACIGLSDHMIVGVRALPNVPKATLVTIEPATEDDWEVVELNAQVAEDAILSQVRIVHERMMFPLWLHGNRIVTFTVVSVVPNKTAVQLMPGTEVAVAPKRRTKPVDHCKEPSNGTHSFQKALLRVQDSHNTLIQESELGGVPVGVELTSIALIHPDTAKNYLFDSLQVVVIVPRLPSKVKIEKSGNKGLRKQLSSSAKDVNGKILTNNEKDFPYAVVRLVLSESASKGHIILCRSLRRYLRVSFHAWLYVQIYDGNRQKDDSAYSLSPCQFRILHKSKDPGNNTTNVGDASINMEDKLSNFSLTRDMSLTDFSSQEELVSSLLNGAADSIDRENGIPLSIKHKLKGLIHAWIMAQMRAISSMTGEKLTSLFLGPATFVSFKAMASGCKPDGKHTSSTTETSVDARLKLESSNEILYMLSGSNESLCGPKYSAYELKIGGSQPTTVHDDLKLFCENLSLGTYVSYDTFADQVLNQIHTSTVSSLSWMGTASSDVTNRLTSLLSPHSGTFPLPGHILIYGPPGSGKTSLSLAASKSLEENKYILAHTVFIGCSAFAIEKESVRQMLCDHVTEALDNAPSIIVFDDLDSIITSSSDTEGSQRSASVVALAEFIAEIMDEYGEKRKMSCGLGPIAFIACVRALDSIPESLTTSGRFNFHIQLPAPSTSERLAILKHEMGKSSLQCSDDILLDVASKCDGYDAYDLATLVGRTIHAAICRYLPSHEADEDRMRPSIIADDFIQARQDFLPVSMRDITKAAPEGGRVGWEDVGGLINVRNAIKEMIELPSKFPNIFAKSPLRLRSNVLLYGPPGCGKTHIVGAAAAASSLRFISIKGPELLNKYIGASEQAVRDVFSRAAAAAPCILFFDEFDSIAPKRGHDNTGVTDRVVNQFLTELDGVEVLTGVFVFAATRFVNLRASDNQQIFTETAFTNYNQSKVLRQAIYLQNLSSFSCLKMTQLASVWAKAAGIQGFPYSVGTYENVRVARMFFRVGNHFPNPKKIDRRFFSRPDLLDAALLRPGRLDRLLFCDFPAVQDRLDILRVISKKLPLADDVDLEAIAYMTDGFSGADLQALLSDAQLAAAQEIIDSGYDSKEQTSPIITGELLNSVASKAKRSVSDSEKQRLYAIYGQFMDSKRSVTSQSRDAKGKRATLA